MHPDSFAGLAPEPPANPYGLVPAPEHKRMLPLCHPKSEGRRRNVNVGRIVAFWPQQRTRVRRPGRNYLRRRA